MCMPSAPAPPALQPQRQAAQAPDASAIAARVQATASRRLGFAAAITTPMGGPGVASTTGKTLLGG